MDLNYHEEITTQALSGKVSSRALAAILKGNFKQDNLINLIGNHPEYHFDDNGVEEGNAYIRQQERLILDLLKRQNSGAHANGSGGIYTQTAWEAFGRITHALQDFYSHSNYVALWASQFNGTLKGKHPDEIEPFIPEIVENPALMTGMVYFPLEALTIFPWLRPIVSRWLPEDSHANMNLDSPERGEYFYYAFSAAKKHTAIALDQLLSKIQLDAGLDAAAQFTDLIGQ